MKKTDFRPSIHGWPFSNNYSFHADLPVGGKTYRNLGYCGGMCWTAQTRYYSATRIPRDTPDPAQGDALYSEILSEQIESLPPEKVLRIFDWQQSPDMSSWSDFHHSLGHRTKQEWPSIRQHIDDGKPVTLTLIANSNDYDPSHLSDNHRVIAYGYDERPLRDGDWVHGSRHASIRKITIWIYDPNFHDDDDVQLSFFTGCDDNWIGLRHNRPGEEFHGFFRDDRSRSYTFADSTTVAINSCVQSSIVSSAAAEYDLRFSWRCRIIPCFCVMMKWNGPGGWSIPY